MLANLAAEAGIRIIGSPQRAQSVTVSYEEMAGHLPRALDRAARLCDLVVFPPIRETDDPEIQDGFIRTLTKLEQPVLLSAGMAADKIGKRVAVGWDGGVACAHALMAAMPYLETAEAIEILSVQNGSQQGRSVEDLAAYLALRELSCTQRIVVRGERSVAEALLETAADGGFDMLVAGGYGHSRLMETIFGGVTDHIVSHAKIPVFMMH
jgi:nucleotide-binding universal stress UspA family protein